MRARAIAHNRLLHSPREKWDVWKIDNTITEPSTRDPNHEPRHIHPHQIHAVFHFRLPTESGMEVHSAGKNGEKQRRRKTTAVSQAMPAPLKERRLRNSTAVLTTGHFDSSDSSGGGLHSFPHSSSLLNFLAFTRIHLNVPPTPPPLHFICGATPLCLAWPGKENTFCPTVSTGTQPSWPVCR